MVVALLTPECSLRAETFPYNPRTTYGEIGILDMPSAHMDPDGELGLTASVLQNTRRFNASFQVLPWLEASFRYSDVSKLFGSKDFYDRSFGMKIRLLNETPDLPDISLGLRDILGTGIYSGEYLVASKHFSTFDVTFGTGWGRFAESNALPNPLASIFSSFEQRRVKSATTGVVDFGQFFHGPKIGLFGGVVWQSPIENLDVLLEYSSDRYTLENSFHAFKVRTPVNVGLAYNLYNSITFSAGWYYGTSYGATLTFEADPKSSTSVEHVGPVLPQPNIRSAQQQVESLNLLLAGRSPASGKPGGPWVALAQADLELRSALLSQGQYVRSAEKVGHTVMVEAALTNAIAAQCDSYARIVTGIDSDVRAVAISDFRDPTGAVEICPVSHRSIRVAADDDRRDDDRDAVEENDIRRKILADIDVQKVRVEALSIDGPEIWLYFTNTSYWSDAEAAGRVARVLMVDAPSEVEVFHIVDTNNGIPQRDFRMARSALERAATTNASAHELGDSIATIPVSLANPVLERAQADSYPRFSWAIGPGLHEGLFDPARPLEIQFLASADATLDVTPQLSVDTRLEANIYNNFNLAQPSDSLLPHVRSDSLLYFREGANGIAKLKLTYRNRLTPDIYYGLKAGYLESMFAGAGGQVLWRPEGERFAIGVDAYQVWQRDFDRLFGVQDYHVLTGHVSLYYASPYYGLNFNVHAGRYLAGDYGATFEVTRRFSTGIEVGAFATFTNVPFSKFGEGSFDKGIIIHIPLEWALPFYSHTSYDLTIRSLTRDGGQRLDGDDFLYDETRSASYGETANHLDDLTSP